MLLESPQIFVAFSHLLILGQGWHESLQRHLQRSYVPVRGAALAASGPRSFVKVRTYLRLRYVLSRYHDVLLSSTLLILPCVPRGTTAYETITYVPLRGTVLVSWCCSGQITALASYPACLLRLRGTVAYVKITYVPLRGAAVAALATHTGTERMYYCTVLYKIRTCPKWKCSQVPRQYKEDIIYL